MSEKFEPVEQESKRPVQVGEQEHEKNLEIASITTTEVCRGIVLTDLNELAHTLEAYADGVGEASDATRDDYMRTARSSTNVGIHGIFNPRYAEASPADTEQGGAYSTNPFIDEIVKGVEEARSNGKKEWSRHYDYDGQGRFHKTTVKVSFDEENHALILELNAAYVGDKVEEELAKALGVERAVRSMGVKIELPEMPHQDLSVPLEERETFRLDCAPIARVIDSVNKKFCGRDYDLTADTFVGIFMARNKFNHDMSSCYGLSLGNGMRLNFGLNGGSRFVWPPTTPVGERNDDNRDNIVDTRRAEGTEIVLPYPTEEDSDKLAVTRDGEPKQIRNYTITFNIAPEPVGTEPDFSRLTKEQPLLTTEQSEKAKAIIEYIQEQLAK